VPSGFFSLIWIWHSCFSDPDPVISLVDPTPFTVSSQKLMILLLPISIRPPFAAFPNPFLFDFHYRLLSLSFFFLFLRGPGSPSFRPRYNAPSPFPPPCVLPVPFPKLYYLCLRSNLRLPFRARKFEAGLCLRFILKLLFRAFFQSHPYLRLSSFSRPFHSCVPRLGGLRLYLTLSPSSGCCFEIKAPFCKRRRLPPHRCVNRAVSDDVLSPPFPCGRPLVLSFSNRPLSPPLLFFTEALILSMALTLARKDVLVERPFFALFARPFWKAHHSLPSFFSAYLTVNPACVRFFIFFDPARF